MDELFYYYTQIGKRQISNYLMLLAISENPHVKDRRTLWDILKNAEKNLEANPENEMLDKAGLEILKARMKANPRIIIKQK